MSYFKNIELLRKNVSNENKMLNVLRTIKDFFRICLLFCKFKYMFIKDMRKF